MSVIVSAIFLCILLGSHKKKQASIIIPSVKKASATFELQIIAFATASSAINFNWGLLLYRKRFSRWKSWVVSLHDWSMKISLSAICVGKVNIFVRIQVTSIAKCSIRTVSAFKFWNNSKSILPSHWEI